MSREYTDKTRDLLSQYHSLKALQDVGDYKATDILLDLHFAVKRANLTRKQREVYDEVYIKGRTQKDVAQSLGISEKAVSFRVAYAIVKIASVLESWNYLDEAEGLAV